MAVTVSDILKELRTELRSGTIAGERLESYLTHIEAASTYQRDMEVWKLRFQTAVQVGQAALKAGILINGAAAVALLAFAQNLIAKGVAPAPGVRHAIVSFVIGVALAAFSSTFVYLTQIAVADETRRRLAWWLNTTAIALGFASLLAFVVGGFFGSRLW